MTPEATSKGVLMVAQPPSRMPSASREGVAPSRSATLAKLDVSSSPARGAASAEGRSG